MRCVIVQPSYIAWRGYFDLVRRADVFVFYDDVQYDKGGWRNRNRVKAPAGSLWLTIPVHKRGAYSHRTPICDIQAVPETRWNRKHLMALRTLYGRAPHFRQYLPWLERTYAAPPKCLADFTIATTVELAGMLGIRGTRFLRSSSLGIGGRKSDRLIRILQKLGATEYLSGPSARSYMEPEKFAEAGIAVEYIDYDYPGYPQLYGEFDPHVSVLDLLFMTGADAPRYIWGA